MKKSRKVYVMKPKEVCLKKEEVDDSNIPLGHVLLKKEYSLISTGTELACLLGKEYGIEYPWGVGYCCVGYIEKKASDVDGFKVGDRIFCYGAHSEYEIIPVKEIFLKVPTNLKSIFVPMVRMATIAATAIRASDIEFGDNVLIVGQGMVGNMAAQLAKMQGGKVIVSDLYKKRLDISKKCGILDVINTSTNKLYDKIKEITSNKMVSTCIDATGISKVILESLDSIAKNGEMILLGSPREEYIGDITQVLKKCHLSPYNITLKGAHEWKYPFNKHSHIKHSIERNSKLMFEYFENGDICLDGFISEIVKPEDCKLAYDKLLNNKEDYMGIMFDWN